MAVSLGKLIPRALIASAAGYCIWPSASAMMSNPEAAPAANLPELSASLLSPKMPPPPTRSPFLPETPPTLAESGDKKSKAPSDKGGVPGKNDGRATVVPLKVKEIPPVNPLAGLSLDATCIIGDSRYAIINGHVYGVHEIIAGKDASTPLTVVDVLADKVLLTWGQKTLELAYSDTAPDASVRTPAKAAAGERTKTAANTKSKTAAPSSSTKKKAAK